MAIRREKIKTLDILADLHKDLFHKIHKKEQAFEEQKKLLNSSQSKIDEQEFVRRDKELKSLRLKQVELMPVVNQADNSDELKELNKIVNQHINEKIKMIDACKNIQNTMYTFVEEPLPKIDNIKIEVKKIDVACSIRKIVTQTIINKDGSSRSIKPEDYPSYDINQHYDMNVNIQTSCLFRALSLIKDKYDISNIEAFIEFVCDNSYIVLPERKKQWFDCLMAGFNNDFNISIGVVKQIENLIRFILEDCNVSIYKPNFSGVLGLGSLLSKKELEDILDEDYLALLKWLFQNVFGPSLRNADAHGNLDDADYDSGIMFFIWWFALRWCVLTVP